MQAIIFIASLFLAAPLTAALLFVSCWMYNRLFNLAPPGRGRAGNIDFSLVKKTGLTYHAMPAALDRYSARETRGTGAPLPGLGKSFLLALIVILICGISGILLGLFLSLVGSSASLSPGVVQLLNLGFGLPLGIMLMGAVLKVGLPTALPRALAISGIYYAICLIALFSILLIALIGLTIAGVEIDWLDQREAMF